MGGDLSKAQEGHLKELREITRQNYFYFNNQGKACQLGGGHLKGLLKYVWDHIPTYPEAGDLRTKTWQEIGIYLHKSPRAPPQILTSWRAVMDALLTQENPLLRPLMEYSLPPYSDIKLVPPEINLANHGSFSSDTLALSATAPSLPQTKALNAVDATIAQARAEGELGNEELLDWGGGISAYPVQMGMDAQMNPQREWKPLPLRVLREIKVAVKDYGIRSSYVKALLEAVAYSNQMIPADWKALLNMILTPAQYLVFDQQWRQMAIQRGNAGVTPDQLYGAGNFATVEQQRDGSPDVLFTLLPQIIFAAISKLTDAGEGSKTFTNIKQQNAESYDAFISRLKVAIERQIDNEYAQQELMMKLAVENANADCKRILTPLVASGPKELADLINACRVVGSQTYQMDALALAFQQQAQGAKPKAAGDCFNCGKPGHFKAQCRAPGGGQHVSKNNTVPRPKNPCPKCKKGYHWANHCRNTKSSDSSKN